MKNTQRSACIMVALLVLFSALGVLAQPVEKWDYQWAWQGEVAYVEKDGKIGLIDRSGNTLISPRFDLVRPFRNGIAAVYEGYVGLGSVIANAKSTYLYPDYIRHPLPGKWGLIDANGHVFVEPCWENEPLLGIFVGSPKIGYRGIHYPDSSTGFMDAFGKLLIDAIWDDVTFKILPKGDPQPVQLGTDTFFLDSEGKVLFFGPYKFDGNKETMWESGSRFMTLRDSKYQAGVIDREGTIRIPFEWDRIVFFDEDYSDISTVNARKDGPALALVTRNDMTGLFDLDKGELIVDPQWQQAAFLGKDRVLAKVNGLWGLVGADGNYLFQPQGVEISYFSEAKILAVKVKENDAKSVWRLLDRDGQLSDAHFSGVENSYTGARYVYNYNGISGQNDYFDLSLNLVISLPEGIGLVGKFSEGLASVWDEQGLYGYVDQNGQVVIELKWHRAEPFENGVAIVSNGFYGTNDVLIDRSGHPLGDVEWDKIERNQEGYFRVFAGDFEPEQNPPYERFGKYGFMNETGKMSIPAFWDSAWDFEEGLAKVFLGYSRGNLYDPWTKQRFNGFMPAGTEGYLNTQGQPVCGVKLTDTSGFAEGSSGSPFDTGFVRGVGWESEGSDYHLKWGLKEQASGKSLLPVEWGEIPILFDNQRAGEHRNAEGLPLCDRFAIVSVSGSSAHADYGVLDLEGKTILKPKWSAIDFDSELNLLIVRDSKGKFGFFDLSGKQIAKPQWDWVEPFTEDRAAIRMGKKFGFINEKFKTVIKPAWDFVSAFSEGYAVVRKGNLYGLVDPMGKVAIKPVWEYMKSAKEQRLLAKKDGQFGFLRPDGGTAVEFVWDAACDFKEGRAKVRKGDSWGFVDPDGQEIGQIAYERVFDFSEGLAAVRKDGKWGFIDLNGSPAITPTWDYVWPFCKGLARVEREGTFGYISPSGELVEPLK